MGIRVLLYIVSYSIVTVKFYLKVKKYKASSIEYTL